MIASLQRVPVGLQHWRLRRTGLDPGDGIVQRPVVDREGQTESEEVRGGNFFGRQPLDYFHRVAVQVAHPVPWTWEFFSVRSSSGLESYSASRKLPAVNSSVSTTIVPPGIISGRLALRAAGSIATNTCGSSPGGTPTRETHLETAHAGRGASGRTNLRCRIGQRADIVAKDRRSVGKMRTSEPHTIAGVAVETNDYLPSPANMHRLESQPRPPPYKADRSKKGRGKRKTPAPNPPLPPEPTGLRLPNTENLLAAARRK